MKKEELRSVIGLIILIPVYPILSMYIMNLFMDNSEIINKYGKKVKLKVVDKYQSNGMTTGGSEVSDYITVQSPNGKKFNLLVWEPKKYTIGKETTLLLYKGKYHIPGVSNPFYKSLWMPFMALCFIILFFVWRYNLSIKLLKIQAQSP